MSYKLKCLVDGPEDGPFMFFIHGWPDSPSLWQKQVAEFSKDYRCIRIELPHYGDENDNIGKSFYSLSEVTDLIIATIEDWLTDSKWEDIILVGHDWGAFFAYQVEAKRPELVSRLITMDIGTYLKPESLFQAVAIITYQWSLVAAFYIGRLMPVVGNFVSRVVGIVVGAPKKSRPHWRMNYLYVNYWSDFFRRKSNSSVSLPTKP